jgi:hypothetical protein
MRGRDVKISSPFSLRTLVFSVAKLPGKIKSGCPNSEVSTTAPKKLFFPLLRSGSNPLPQISFFIIHILPQT